MKYFIYTILFLFPALSFAATVRMDPEIKKVGSGDVFVGIIRLDVTQDECVNAANIVISYPKDLFRLNALSHGESIFSLWVDEQVNHDEGKASFTAGIPGGYCGRALGDPGQTNILGKVIFQYRGLLQSGDAQISFSPESEVILNDGEGSKTPLLSKAMTVQFVPPVGSPKNEWISEVSRDTFPPETFSPEIVEDNSTMEKLNYLVFTATDKQSGIEHYEVVEEDPRSFGFRFGSRVKAKISTAKSPYLLVDQTLSSRIIVRAYDHAGNMEEVIIPPKHLPKFFDPTKIEDYIAPLVIVVLCLSVIGIVAYMKRRRQDEEKYSVS